MQSVGHGEGFGSINGRVLSGLGACLVVDLRSRLGGCADLWGGSSSHGGQGKTRRVVNGVLGVSDQGNHLQKVLSVAKKRRFELGIILVGGGVTLGNVTGLHGVRGVIVTLEIGIRARAQQDFVLLELVG